MSATLPRLETERLLLAALQPEQAQTLASLADDPLIAQDTATVPSPYRLEDASNYIASIGSEYATNGNLTLGMHLRHEQQLIGVINLRINPVHRVGHFGYWVGAPARGNGYASEALTTLLHYGFTTLDLMRMQSNCFARNRASARTMENAGLLLEGCMKGSFFKNGVFEDRLIYGLLRSDWARAQTPDAQA